MTFQKNFCVSLILHNFLVKRDKYTEIKISILKTFFSRTGSRLSPPEIQLLLSIITYR